MPVQLKPKTRKKAFNK